MHPHWKIGRFWQGALFLFVYFVVFPILTDLEYLHEWAKLNPFFPSSMYRIASGLLEMIPYGVYYFVLVPRLLFTKKYLYFLGALLLWLILFDQYIHFVIDWGVSQMSFLPYLAREWASNSFHRQVWVRQAITLSVTNLLVITALAYFIRSADQERLVSQLKEQQMKLELEYLKAQMNPHFFFNTLNNIYSLAQEGSGATAPMVARLSEMMRYVLYDSREPKVALSKEMDFIRNFIDVESIRFPDNISVRFDWRGDPEGLLIEPMLLMPLVENAFKHGIREELDQGFVEVLALLADGELTLEVRNSKPGHAAVPGGLGLQNVRKRLSLLYPGRHALRIEDSTSRHDVLLTLQLI